MPKHASGPDACRGILAVAQLVVVRAPLKKMIHGVGEKTKFAEDSFPTRSDADGIG